VDKSGGLSVIIPKIKNKKSCQKKKKKLMQVINISST